MTLHSDHAQSLASWYQTQARSFVEEHAADRTPQLDQDVARLVALCTMLHSDMPVCFLGSAGVGKSTLINALVAGQEVILPAGGVGPLTAEATHVRYGEKRRFFVEYHLSSKLNQILFALERAHERDLGRQETAALLESDVSAELSDEERSEAEETSAVIVDGEPGASALGLVGALARQATHLIRGDQYATLERDYVLDRLRECLDLERRWGTEAAPQDLPRIVKIKEVLARARRGDGTFELGEDSHASRFRSELQLHAAGFLAPLVRSIQVVWNAELLRSGVVLVDLPGLGVANDQFRSVTTRWIRKARGVVLVVDKSGMSEASADLLRTSGFLSSLLHDSDDAEEQDATLFVAVVKLDATADDARANEKLINPGNVRPWAAHFDEACERAKVMVREQLAMELHKLSEQGGESTRDDRARVVQRVLERMRVHPVVAPEYRKLLADDEDDRPLIKTAEQSRVPELQRALSQLVHERDLSVDERIERLATNLQDRLRGVLELVEARGEQETARRKSRARKLRQELEAVAEPLRREFINKQGEFREFLRSTIPTQIEARVDAAAANAGRDIGKHLRRYQNYHWATLRAAIRRGGTFDGSRVIDLPADLAQLFEEPIAIVWSKHILADLRQRTAGIAKEYVSILGELLAWSRDQGDAVDVRVIEALHRELQAELQELSSVGREAIDELKTLVKEELYANLEKKVRERCQRFVKAGADRGAGVKGRMLELLEDLGGVVVEAARPVAREVLTRAYRKVEEEIRAKFDKYRNPIDVATEELLNESNAAEERSTQERQRAISGAARQLLKELSALGQSQHVGGEV